MKKDSLVKSEKSQTRNSNIEILRIISMLLIIAFHMRRNGYSNYESLTMYSTISALGIWGILGVDIFLIISAWFLSNQQFRIKKVIHLVFQIFTWIIFFAIIYLIYDAFYLKNGVWISIKDLIKYIYRDFFRPFYSYYWFITTYFFMLLAHPFLNKMLDKLNKLQIKKILIVFLFVLIYSQFSTSIVGDVFTFLYVYLLIGYIKKYGCHKLSKYAKPRFCILAITIVIAVRFLYFYLNKYNLFKNYFSMLLDSTIGCIGRHSIIILLLAMLIFFTVLNKKPTFNKIVNRVASCCLGVYIFHENGVFGFPNITNKLCTKLNSLGFMDANLLFPIKYIGVALILFIAGVILEFFRDLIIQRPFMKWFSNKFSYKLNKIDDWFNNF